LANVICRQADDIRLTANTNCLMPNDIRHQANDVRQAANSIRLKAKLEKRVRKT